MGKVDVACAPWREQGASCGEVRRKGTRTGGPKNQQRHSHEQEAWAEKSKKARERRDVGERSEEGEQQEPQEGWEERKQSHSSPALPSPSSSLSLSDGTLTED